MTPLILSLRQAKIGSQIQSQGEMHGEESKTAMRIPIVAMMINKEEFNKILGDDHAWNSFFNESPTDITKAVFTSLKPLGIKHKFKNGCVRIIHGLSNDEIVLMGSTLSKIFLQPRDGGLAEMKFTVNSCPTLDARAALLLAQINHEVQVEVSAELSAEDAQRPLELPEPAATGAGADEDDEDEDDDN